MAQWWLFGAAGSLLSVHGSLMAFGAAGSLAARGFRLSVLQLPENAPRKRLMS